MTRHEREQILAIMDRASGGMCPPEATDGEIEAFRIGYYEGLADGLKAADGEALLVGDAARPTPSGVHPRGAAPS